MDRFRRKFSIYFPNFWNNQNFPKNIKTFTLTYFSMPTIGYICQKYLMQRSTKKFKSQFWVLKCPLYHILSIRIFLKNPKYSLPYFGRNINLNFSQKKPLSPVCIYWIQNSCKNSEKRNEPILGKWHSDRRTMDRQMDRAEFVRPSGRAQYKYL